MKNTRYMVRKIDAPCFNDQSSRTDKIEYDRFMTEVVNGIGEYLPEKYASYEISIEKIPKNNSLKDCLRITDPKAQEASPNVYLDELYGMYGNGTPLEDVLRSAAALFTYGMDYAREMSLASMRACERTDNIIAQVLNTQNNLAMLKDIPHKDYLDLSVIYRHYIALPDGTFNLATVSQVEREHIGISEAELHELALRNTKRLLPIKREHMGEQVYLLTNRKHLLGANVLLYKGQLRWIARKCKSDIFLAASSIHEVMALPVSEARLSFLRQTVYDANRNVVRSEEVLSDTVYRYDRERDLLLPAWEDPLELKNWEVERHQQAPAQSPVC